MALDVGGTGGQDVDGCQPGLFPGWDEDQDGFFGRVLHNGVVHGLGHGQQPSLRVADVETLPKITNPAESQRIPCQTGGKCWKIGLILAWY